MRLPARHSIEPAKEWAVRDPRWDRQLFGFSELGKAEEGQKQYESVAQDGAIGSEAELAEWLAERGLPAHDVNGSLRAIHALRDQPAA
jgi:hypothetical protein